MLAFASSASAQVNIFATPTVGVGTNETITLSATGTGSADNLSLTAVLGDGGANPPFNGTDTGPTFVSFTPIGAFGGATIATGASFPLAQTSVFTIGSATPVSGAFLDITVDTSSLSIGDTFDLFLDAPAAGPAFTTFFSGNNLDIETSFESPFVITVVGESENPVVPEPSSAAILFAMGSFLSLKRRRA